MFSFSECNLRGYSKNTAYILAQIKAMLVGILAFVALAEDTPLCPDTTDRPLVLQPDWGNKKVNLNLLNWAKEPLTATVLEPGAKEERVCVDRGCDGMFFPGINMPLLHPVSKIMRRHHDQERTVESLRVPRARKIKVFFPPAKSFTICSYLGVYTPTPGWRP